MTQQLNLFDPAFRKPRHWLSAATILAVVMAVVAGMGGYAHFARQRVALAEVALRQVDADFKRLTEELANVGSRPVPVASKVLVEELAEAEARAAARRVLVEALKGDGIGNTQGYSAVLGALARQHVDGVWLTGIGLAAGGEEFRLHGRALRAELVPDYLALLKREDSLRGRTIGELRLLEREQDGAPGSKARFIEFTVGTTAGSAAGSSEGSGAPSRPGEAR